jgi:hypothetical protein
LFKLPKVLAVYADAMAAQLILPWLVPKDVVWAFAFVGLYIENDQSP